jgi:hypothetical protein
VIYHYFTPDRAFVGASVATGSVYRDKISWAPHGTVGRSKTGPRQERPAWRLPIGRFTQSNKPLTLKQVQEDDRWVRAWIEGKRALGRGTIPVLPTAAAGQSGLPNEDAAGLRVALAAIAEAGGHPWSP